MKLQIVLNPALTAAWSGIVQKPEFVGMNMAGVLNTLMHHYLNPQTTRNTTSSKPGEPEKPVMGKVELRQQAEHEACLARLEVLMATGLDKARRGEMEWPKPLKNRALDEAGRVKFNFPIEYRSTDHNKAGQNFDMHWTPPADYPKNLADEVWEIKLDAELGVPVSVVVDNDPPPNEWDYETEAEHRVALDAWKVRTGVDKGF